MHKSSTPTTNNLSSTTKLNIKDSSRAVQSSQYDENSVDKTIEATLASISSSLRKVITETPKIESVSDLSPKQQRLYKQVLVNKVRAQRQLLDVQTRQASRGFHPSNVRKSVADAGSKFLSIPEAGSKIMSFLQKHPVVTSIAGKFLASQLSKKGKFGVKSLAILGAGAFLFKKFTDNK